MTKHLDGPAMDQMLSRIGSRAHEGRAASAPGVIGSDDKNSKEKKQNKREEMKPKEPTFEFRENVKLSVSWAQDTEDEESRRREVQVRRRAQT